MLQCERVKIVYHPNYNISFGGLERLHPFDSRKYGRAWDALHGQFGKRLDEIWLKPERPISEDELRLVHSTEYLRQLRSATQLARILELPFLALVPARVTDYCVLRPMRWATMGTLLAARQALRTGRAVNLSGGYHHAKPGGGEGFCVYADVAVAVRVLRQERTLANTDGIIHIDLDAHQGNGVCHCFMPDQNFFTFDMFNADIYPSHDIEARRRIDCPVPLASGCGNAEYLKLLREKLPEFLDFVCHTTRARLAFYNAGTDVYEGDALGRLSLSAKGVLERDRFVFEELKRRALPTVMLLSGGYSRESFRLVTRTVEWLLR
ncbi:MAG: histone deacetylase [Verrucomicrobiota bacterium]